MKEEGEWKRKNDNARRKERNEKDKRLKYKKRGWK